MRVKVYITLTDQTSEGAMIARGVTSKKLLDIYTQGFKNFLEGIKSQGVKIDLHVAVDDNTKEDTK